MKTEISHNVFENVIGFYASYKERRAADVVGISIM